LEEGSRIAFGATGAREDGFEKEAAEGAESGGDVAVRSSTLNVESVGGGNERFAFEDTAKGVDLGGGPSGEVGEGAFDDLGALAEALAEEDGGRGVAVGDGFDIHGYSISNITNNTSIEYRQHGYINKSARRDEPERTVGG